MTTFEHFVEAHGLSLLFVRTVRTTTEVFGPGHQSVKETEEWTCEVVERNARWEIRMFKNGKNEFMEHLPRSGKTQAQARLKLAEAMRGGILGFTPGPGAEKERIEIQVPDDLE
jgi:hypothetical protein